MEGLSNKFVSLFVVFVLFVISVTEATHTLTVDCNSKIRKSTHCASGSLYGLIENKPADIETFVAPLHPFAFNNPARAGNGRQQPIGDAIKVAKRIASIPGATVSIRLADFLPGWPYNYRGMDSWKNEIKSFVEDKKASGLTNWYGYEIWNEPDGTWTNSNGNFNDFWKQTYQYLRQVDPNEKIIGPSLSWYNEGRIKEFLQFAKANDCLPDIISWHELSGIDGMSSHFRSYRNLERSLGIEELPISINEYCDAKHELEGQPGSSARFIGKFERYKIDSGMITWWFVPLPGRLGSLLASDTQKGAGWYLYKWYGDMNGDMVSVTPPKDDSDLVDGAACVDEQTKTVRFIFGGPNDGSIDAVFKNLPSFVGSNPTVKVEKVDWRNKDTPSNGPDTISEKEYSVINGQLTINVPGTNASSGYHIIITGSGSSTSNPDPEPTPKPTPQPTPQTNPQTNPPSSTTSGIANGGTYEIVNRQSGKCLCVQYDAIEDDSNVHQWEYIAHTSQQWIITKDGNDYIITDVKSKKPLDVRAASTQDGGNVVIMSSNGGSNQRWTIKETDNGYVTIQNSKSGKYLDVEKGSLEDGGNVIQWTGNGNDNQQWKLIRLDADANPTSPNLPQAPSTNSDDTSNCSPNILKQGYKCCPSDCTIYYTDDDGTWGVHDGEWCGCNVSSNAVGNCSATIIAQGYPCCSDNNCEIYVIDESGSWGIEKNAWCGISNKC